MKADTYKGDTYKGPLCSLKKFWEDRGKTYNSLGKVRFEGISKIVNKITKLVDDKLVLDIGCGPGMVASLFPQDTKVIGLDFSGPMLKSAKSRIRELMLGSALNLPFYNEVFEVVTCLFLASDYSIKDKFFTEAYRVIEDNGLFIFADYSPNDESWILRRRIQPVNIFIEDEKSLSNKLERAGFKVQKSEFIRFNPSFNLGRYIKSERELEQLKETDVNLWRYIQNRISSNKIRREFILIISKK